MVELVRRALCNGGVSPVSRTHLYVHTLIYLSVLSSVCPYVSPLPKAYAIPLKA